MGQYLLSVIAAAIILGILDGILDKKSAAAGLLRLIGELFLTFVLLQPITKMDFSSIADYIAAFSVEGESAAVSGEDIAGNELRSIIKSETEAYILDKAQAYGLALEVDVTLSEGATPIPVSVQLVGDASPYAKWQLQKLLAENLGIEKEGQQWTG